ncbi:MAG: hypothetical protein ACMXYC_04455 [Candidatus Woesearchaeota archaeon]
MATTKQVVQPYYIGVTNHQELHRYVLESSKGILQSLKLMHSIELDRATKKKKCDELHKIMSELHNNVLTLKKILPEAQLPKRKVKKDKKGKPAKQVESVTVPVSGINRLEEEIKRIEAKLQKML